MIWLLQQCSLVATDSGGLQKEAYFFGKHCVTMRNEAEWQELVDVGWNMLVGADRDELIAACCHKPLAIDTKPSLYGSGNAGKAIVDAL
jgi:UDP-GlcNAc3NAcA epimerase